MTEYTLKVARTYISDLTVSANTTADAVDKILGSINNCTHYHKELVREENGSNEVLSIRAKEL